MHRIGVDAHHRETLLEAHGEQHVGGLRLAIARPRVIGAVLVMGVLEMDRAHVVPAARQVDDAPTSLGAAAALDQRHQFRRQREVAEVVGAKLPLEAIVGVLEGGGHHAGVVDEDVDLVKPLAGARSGGADAFERAQIERDRVELCIRHGVEDRGDRLVELGLIAPRHHDMRALGRHRRGGLLPQPRVCSGDEYGHPRQVLAFQHLVGGTSPAEFAHLPSPSVIASVHIGIRDRVVPPP